MLRQYSARFRASGKSADMPTIATGARRRKLKVGGAEGISHDDLAGASLLQQGRVVLAIGGEHGGAQLRKKRETWRVTEPTQMRESRKRSPHPRRPLILRHAWALSMQKVKERDRFAAGVRATFE